MIISEVVSGMAGPLFKLVDNLFTSDEERAKAKLKIIEMEQEGKLSEMRTQLSAILAEANSKDPWTSRARPTFMYVIYIMILISIPMGFLGYFHPDLAKAVAEGMDYWLKAIPESLWTLFGVGYLGYTGGRTWEKTKGVAK